MRVRSLCIVVVLVLAASAPASAAHWLVRVHPGPWRPATPLMSGIRFEPETGEAPALQALRAAGARELSLARARAEASVVREADGSRHARTQGAFRRYTVVSTATDGSLQQTCVHSAAEAEAIVRAAAAKEQK